MKTTIKLRGTEYPVGRFSSLHFSALQSLFEADNRLNPSLQAQSVAAEAIKEVFLPTIPDDLIYCNPRGLYVFLLEPVELSQLCVDLVGLWEDRQIEKLDPNADAQQITRTRARQKKRQQMIVGEITPEEFAAGAVQETEDAVELMRAGAGG